MTTINFAELQNLIAEQGEAAYANLDACIAHGWYDWFCENDELRERAKAFFPIILGVDADAKIKPEWHVWFKNNCPAVGDLYDDLRLSSELCNEMIITHNSPHDDAQNKPWVVYMPSNGYEEPVALFDTPEELVLWLNNGE